MRRIWFASVAILFAPCTHACEVPRTFIIVKDNVGVCLRFVGSYSTSCATAKTVVDTSATVTEVVARAVTVSGAIVKVCAAVASSSEVTRAVA